MEDINLTRKAIRFRKAHPDEHGMSLEDLFRGRLVATFFMSGPFGMVSIPLGYWLQRLTNAWVGLIATILIIMVVSSIAYQFIWYRDNHRLYAQLSPSDRFRELQRDLWPVHWTGIRTGLILSAISTYWLIGIVVGLFEKFAPGLAKVLPHNVFLLLAEFILVQGPFLRIMGEFFDRHAKRLAVKYEGALTHA